MQNACDGMVGHDMNASGSFRVNICDDKSEVQSTSTRQRVNSPQGLSTLIRYSIDAPSAVCQKKFICRIDRVTDEDLNISAQALTGH